MTPATSCGSSIGCQSLIFSVCMFSSLYKRSTLRLKNFFCFPVRFPNPRVQVIAAILAHRLSRQDKSRDKRSLQKVFSIFLRHISISIVVHVQITTTFYCGQRSHIREISHSVSHAVGLTSVIHLLKASSNIFEQRFVAECDQWEKSSTV